MLDDSLRSSFTAGLPTRNSKDLVLNGKGESFYELCEDYGLHIVNGCTRGDEEGNFTFIGGTGESVNDICAVSHDILQHIESFKVEEKVWSDHMPIVLTLSKIIYNSPQTPMKLLPKLKWDENKTEIYKNKLNELLSVYQRENETLQLKQLTEIIQLANPVTYKPPLKTESKWFNYKCQNARKRSFLALRSFKKDSTDANKQKYIEANRKFKDLCEVSKINYFKNLELKINAVKNSKDWWSLVKEIRHIDTQELPGISANEFGIYFSELLNPPQNSNDILYAPMNYYDEYLDGPILPTEIKYILSKAKYNKAPGEDRVSYEFFKNATDIFIEEMAKSFNIIFDSAKLDEKFITSIIFPIFKKGDRSLTSNYRGISFMNTIAKIFMGILNNRLNRWLEEHNVITESQAGFREGYSTVDNIYNLAAITNIKLNENRKVYAFFVDFKAAFDKVSRKSLIYKLHDIGISTKIVNMIDCIYSKTNFKVWTGETLSENFDTTTGVKQGCILSPTLFSIYLNDLHRFLEGGINIESLNIRLLLYADDIVILADDVKTMQKMISNLEKYCETWNLEVNLSKSEMVIFRKGGRISKHEQLFFNNVPIKIVSEYTYLGVTLTPKMSFSKHLNKRNISAKNSINATWANFLGRKEISLNAKWNLFQSVCRAIQSYGAQVWGFKLFEEVDKLQRFFLKKILKLPTFTPTYILMLETGIENNHIYTLDLHLRYIIKTLFTYGNNRLPNQLTLILLQKKLFWYKDIEKLSRECGTINIEDCSTRQDWEYLREEIISRLKLNDRETFLRKASQTTRFYSKLNYGTIQNYFGNITNINIISWIFKARCDLIELNATRFPQQQQHRSQLCSLCNIKEPETLYHFLAICPILQHIRYQYFRKLSLPEYEVVNILNNVNFSFNDLFRYIIDAIKYRKDVIREFNY